MTDITITEVDRDAPAQSPFLPGTNVQFAWDSTSLGYMKTCPRLYQYMMIDGWGEGDESIHLRFGIEYHKALEDYDRMRATDISHDDAVHTTVHETLIRTYGWEVDTDTKAGKYKNRHSLIRTVIWYLEKFKDDPAKTYIMEDGIPAVELSFRFELDWGPEAAERLTFYEASAKDPVLRPVTTGGDGQPYILCGHLDRVVSYQDQLFVMDRKTTTTTPGSYYFNQFEPNNQMTLYTLASQVILNSPIKGVIIDAAQILIDTNAYVRGFTYRTADQLEEWTKDLQYWFDLAESYATANYWPMNDTACDKFGGCRFREICSKSPSVREQFLKSKFTKLAEDGKWNPLKPR